MKDGIGESLGVALYTLIGDRARASSPEHFCWGKASQNGYSDKCGKLIDLGSKCEFDRLDGFENPLQKMYLDGKHCFLCGTELNAANRTKEHVIPGWLQRKFGLWNKRLLLPNGTPIPYRQLKIPSCDSCNGQGLSKVENKVRSGVEGGYAHLSRLDKLSIFQWVAKMFYVLLYKDLSLLADRSDPTQGTIVDEELLRAIRNTHALLQSVNRPFELVSGQPFSILVLNVHELENDAYDFRDNFEEMTLAIRIGDVGIVAALQDHDLIPPSCMCRRCARHF